MCRWTFPTDYRASGTSRDTTRWPAEACAASPDYRYVTPSTTTESSTGEIGSAKRNAAHTSDFRRYERATQKARDRTDDERRCGDHEDPTADGRRGDGNGDSGQPQDVADHQPADPGDPDRGSQKLIMWPARPWKHSCSASDSVGWVCTLRASSVPSDPTSAPGSVRAAVRTRRGPIRWPPSSSPYLRRRSA